MDEREVKMLMEDVAAVMRSLVSNAVSPLLARIDGLQKEVDALRPSASAQASLIADLKKETEAEFEALAEEVQALRTIVADPEPTLTLDDVTEQIEKAIASIPTPKDGKDGKDADPELIKTMVADAVAALPAPEKGKDADPAETEEMVVKHVERILAGWEKPKDGKDGAPGEKGADGAPGRDGIDGQNGKDGADGRDGKDGTPGLNGKDGVDVMDVVIDREGNAVFTMSDGRMKNVGLVVGKDGEPGRDGRDGAPGINGKDGADGVGFDDMSCEIRDDGVYLVWEKGELVKEARIPIPMDRGIYKQGQTYRAGDGVTWGGSFWIAQEETAEKPDSGKGWRLAVKKGRDGKDAPDPKKGR